MDDVTARTRPPSRRMASAKPAATTRTRGTTRSTRDGGAAQVSPARWAGIILVITAIVAAAFLAVVSPGGDQEPSEAVIPPLDETSTPAPTVLDTRVPTGQPTIVSPVEGVTDEYEIDVTVEIPQEPLARRLLTLVVLRGDEELQRLPRPKPQSTVTVSGIRLLENTENELAAALEGPGGLGPRSAPVIVTHDRDAPSLAITTPTKGASTYDEAVVVEGSSEVGAEVRVRNESNGFGPRAVVVGPDGTFDVSVKLKRGNNRIVAESEDQTGQTRTEEVRVRRLDGRPELAVKRPKSIEKASLPRTIRISVTVTDRDGGKMPGATVTYTLGGNGYQSDTHEDVTDADGASTWRPELEWSNSLARSIPLAVKVVSPYGDIEEKRFEIPLS